MSSLIDLSCLAELEADNAAPFPLVTDASPGDTPLAFGGDLSLPRLLNAYRSGIFPWFNPGDPILWWSPNPRCVFLTAQMHLPKRLQRFLKTCDWQIRADTVFEQVMQACALPRHQGDGTWISEEMFAAYADLQQAGFAHSIEVFDGDQLIGGLYGVCIGQMFFAESMFSKATHASKVALLALARQLNQWGMPVIDAQVPSEHLFTLGAGMVERAEFLQALDSLVHRLGPEGCWQNLWPNTRAADLLEICA